MSEQTDFERLKILFQRSKAIPHLRGTALELVTELERDAPNPNRLEEIVSADPALTAAIVRTACSAFYGRHDRRFTTIRGAIHTIGFRSVKALALSLAIHGLVLPSDSQGGLDPNRYVRHSLFVGLMGSALYERQAGVGPRTDWVSDEVLAAGLLHEIVFPLLWRVAPEVFNQVLTDARLNRCAPSQAFLDRYQYHPGELGAITIRSWGLPEIYAEAMSDMHYPNVASPSFTACACLHFADCLAGISGFTLSDLEPIWEPASAVARFIGLQDTEALELIAAVGRQVLALHPDRQNLAA